MTDVKLKWEPGDFDAYELETAFVRLSIKRHDRNVHWQAHFYGGYGVGGAVDTVEQAKAQSIDITVRTMQGIIKQLRELKGEA